MFEKFKKKDVVEFVNSNGTTFIGEFVEVFEDVVIFENVLKINLTPTPTEDGKAMMMVPKLDIMNFYSVGNTYVFKVKDILYSEVLIYDNFITYYKEHYEQFDKMKKQTGSKIDIVDSIPQNIKAIK